MFVCSHNYGASVILYCCFWLAFFRHIFSVTLTKEIFFQEDVNKHNLCVLVFSNTLLEQFKFQEELQMIL
jgi:hypothetical protein